MQGFQTVVYIVLGLCVLIMGVAIVRKFHDYSVRTKLLVSIIGIAGLSVAIFGTFVFNRTQQTQTFWTKELQTAVQQQSRQQIVDATQFEAHTADQELSQVTNAIKQLADYRATLYEKQAFLEDGGYWDGNSKLTLLSSGQYGNTTSDPASVFIPNIVTLDQALIADLNTSMQLDFSAPSVLKANPNVVAVYYISANNFTVYYPNIDLANNVPPDFNPLDQPFYTIAAPENNPERKAKWTDPYQDPAGTGLIVTNAVPVYDQNNRFRGVLAADIQLTKISEQISTIKIGKSGFAFLIDFSGHIVSMPEAGYKLFDIQPEDVPVNESPKQTLLGLGSIDLQVITQQMVAGEKGLSTATIQDAQYYVAYTSLPTIGYSIGLIAPTAELDDVYLNAQDEIQQETQSTTNLLILILLAVVLVAGGISVLLSQFISRPIVQLTKVATEVSEGNLDVKAEIQATDETGVLANAFNLMISQLRESITTLERRVADRTKALATSAEVTRRLATVLNPTQLVGEVVNEVRAAFDYYYTQIYLLDEAGENLVLAGGTGDAGAKMLARGHSLPKGRGLVGRAADANASVLVPDVSQEEGWLSNELLPETRAEAAISISVGNQVLGVLDVQHSLVNGLTEDDVTLLESLAGQVAISLQNARSYEQSRKQAELESLVNLIGQRIQRTTSVEETLQTAIRELGTAIGARRVRARIGNAHPAVEPVYVLHGGNGASNSDEPEQV